MTRADEEGADFAEDLFDHSVARDAGPAHDLDAAVGDAEQGLGHGDLGHRAFGRAQGASVQHAGAPADHQLGLKPSRAEPGNLRYDLWQDQSDPNRFVLDELYADADAVAAHRATPHFQNYLSQIGDLAERAAFVLNPVSAT